MVSKDQKKRQRRKVWLAQNNDDLKKKRHTWYIQDKQSATELARSRMMNDQISRKPNKLRVKARLHNNSQYRENNKLRALNRDYKKRNNPDTRQKELAKVRGRIETKLNTDAKCKKDTNRDLDKIRK